ncbi:transcription antiterminator [Leptospira perolatii]|uniref:Transcription antiterminator n=1 Tax=Leptospira perolatii TaxID=2023191 RepID=A0A2M9ZR69_9LEPT|nr:UpxY family transcription antiterminator [Leptospira perolatii]PJZ71046.1 transcription antiterminator [Leptospira perolatii]PJZ74578.1 transcription antiterminator [Leptospira perolatii]
MIESEKSWYAVYTLPRSEKKLAAQLEKKGIITFLPTIPIRRKWSDRMKTIEEPIFASYLFVRIDLNKEKIAVLQTSGAHHFLSIGGEIKQIPDEDIDLVQIFVREYPDRVKIELEELIAPGNKVLIAKGPFAGHRAKVLRKGNMTKVVVSIEGIQGSVSIELDPELLENCEEA